MNNESRRCKQRDTGSYGARGGNCRFQSYVYSFKNDKSLVQPNEVQEIFQVHIIPLSSLSEHISGELSLLRQQCDEFITEVFVRKAAPYNIYWRHRAANVRIFKTAVPQEPN
jgi:hypothetical protein